MDLKKLTKLFHELESRVEALEKAANKRSLPPEQTPNTYVLMVDATDIDEATCAVATIHVLPNRGKARQPPVVNTNIMRGNCGAAILRTVGATLRTVVTHCPEKLTLYVGHEGVCAAIDGRDQLKDGQHIADMLSEDIDALRKQFPIELKWGIPEGFKEDIKSLISQAELEYIRQKEKSNVVESSRSSENSGGANG